MSLTSIASRVLGAARVSLAVLALEQMIFAPAIQAQSPSATPPQTQSPIQHVIIIVGDLRSPVCHLYTACGQHGQQSAIRKDH
jgi:hypothetical protein